MMNLLSITMSAIALVIFAGIMIMLAFGHSSKRMVVGDYEIDADAIFFILAIVGGCICGLLIWLNWQLGAITLADPKTGRLYKIGSWLLICSLSALYGNILLTISKEIRSFIAARIQGGSRDGSRYRGNSKKNGGVFHQIYRGLRHWWKHRRK